MAKPTKLKNGKWRIRYADQSGVRCSAVFENYKDANYVLSNSQSEIEKIKRGLKPALVANKTFDELVEIYLLNRTPLKSRPQDDISIINAHLKPKFNGMKLVNIGAHTIDEYKLSKKHLAKKTVNHHLTLLTTMLNYAHDLKWLSEKPRVKKHKIKIFDRDFNYLKTDAEVVRFLTEAKEFDQKVFTLYATAIFTGLRKGELVGLKRSCIDFDRRLITVQKSYDKVTKSGEVRFVPILDTLLPILREWMLKNPCEYVFPNINNEMLMPCAGIFKENFYDVVDACDFPKIIRHGKERRYIVFHDLRHTFASHWVMKGGDIFKLQKILGHSTVAMTMRYAHLSPDAFSEDFNIFGEKLKIQNSTILKFTKA